MRKQTKLVAVLSAAALLAIGASMTSFVAQGWQEENGTWVYYDKDGYQVTDQWQKSGNNWFYLNGDGEMATDELIDDGNNYYYVDSNGVMVANSWVAVENENAGEEDEPDAYWYYFQANGKAYKSTGAASWKTINGKQYAFDSEGKMLYGWVSKADATRITGDLAWQTGDYFCGDENDGARASGWAKIAVVDDDGEDQNYWFYFNPSNGTKTVDNNKKSINGKKYSFDDYGVMNSEWTYVDASAATAAVSAYSYYNGADEGWRLQKGWVKAVPAEDVDPEGNDNEDTHWYYADGSGNIYNSAIKTINSKKYAFNQKGEMLSGLWALNMSGNDIVVKKDGTIDGLKIDDADKIEDVKDAKYDNYTIYYFGGGEDGAAKTGNQNIDIDGESYAYTFGTTGTAKYKGEQTTSVTSKTKAIYVRGQKVKADKDYRYEATNLSGDKSTGAAALNKYLVNTSGSIMKNKKSGVKDSDDFTYITDTLGQVTAVKDADGKVIAGSVN